MMCPPMIMSIRIRKPRTHFTIWLPFFLILPILLVIALLLAPFVLVLALALWHRGWGKPLILAAPLIYNVICAMRGMKVDVKDHSEHVRISVK